MRFFLAQHWGNSEQPQNKLSFPSLIIILLPHFVQDGAQEFNLRAALDVLFEMSLGNSDFFSINSLISLFTRLDISN